MKSTIDNFFKRGNFTLFLFLFLFQSLSHGEVQQILETFSEEFPREDNNHSNQTKSSQWSVKGELLAGFAIPAERISPVIPISLEFQPPIGIENKLAGSGRRRDSICS